MRRTIIDMIRLSSALQARLPLLRSISIALAGLAGAIGFLIFLNHLQPVKDWLLWDVLRLWGWQALLAAACLSAGHLLLLRIFRVGATGLELVALSIAVGFVTFALGMYLGGLLGLYGPVFAVSWPAIMLAGGALTAWPAARDSFRRWRETPVHRPSPLAIAATVFGVVCIAILYLGVVSPDAVNYDAAWMHITIAQDYAREGRIVAFPGDWIKNVPHLGSVVNTWGFLLPGLGPPPLRWMMALHTEFAFVLWTLVGVGAAARWLLEDQPAPIAWVAFFLFPGIFLYDSSLGGAADHFLAFFIPPLFLAGVRAAESLAPRAWALTGVLAAGAVLTKLQAFYVLVPLALLMAVRAIAELARRSRDRRLPPLQQLLLCPALAVASLALVTAPHFLKNWVYFHNPFYPMLQHVFRGSTPSPPDGALQFDYLTADWRWQAPPKLVERVKSSLELVLTFSFKPHYYFAFHKSLPLFGSLLTLSLPLVLFVRGRRRLLAGLAVSLGAIFLWAYTYRVDRNLQIVMPLLAATTAAVLARAWAAGRMARVGVAALVFVQAGWGAGLLVTGNDRGVMGVDRLASGLSLLRSGYDERAADRYTGYRQAWVQLGKSLPRDALLLLHNHHVSLGIDRRIVLDWVGFQGIIDYRDFRTPRDLWERLHALGVTHVAGMPGARTAASKQEDVVYHAFRELVAGSRQTFGGFEVFAMPASAPAVESPYQVLTVGVAGYADGVYPIEKLSVCEELPSELQHFPAPGTALSGADGTAAALGKVKAVIVAADHKLGDAANEVLQRDFHPLWGYPGFSIYLRNR